MPYISVDVEADGPIPGDYSMIALGAVVCEPGCGRSFLGHLAPISERWIPEALAVSGFSREQTLGFAPAKDTMQAFATWVLGIQSASGRVMFIADNNGFDWSFVNWYFHHFTGGNPFGHSSTNLGSLWKGMQRNVKANFKHLRRTRHDHNPVNDAIGNAEAFLAMQRDHGLSVPG
jgi:hypothetical protein